MFGARIKIKLISLFICFSLLFAAASFAGWLNNDQPYVDPGQIVYEGQFPHDQNLLDDQRGDAVIISFMYLEKSVTVESRDNNLVLVYCVEGQGDIKLWRYTDYSHVNKISLDATNEVIRIYYSSNFFKQKDYVVEFNMNTFKKKKRRL